MSADRIKGIVDAAESAAADIRAEAASLRETEPSSESRISRERLVAELADALVARAEELSRDAKDLADVLDRASKRLDPSPAVSTAPPGTSVPESHDPEPTPISTAPGFESGDTELREKVADRFATATASAESPEGRRVPFKRRSSPDPKPVARAATSVDGLRLLATQMAVAGSTREEIEARLRDEFQVSDTSSVLGDFGRGSVGTQGRNG
ncbi:MAG TPA: hypothetical protein VD766_02810 [Solirubrobacterales bacterium]|nr:hypothetical protein [Solirubrobacterales bacterium]